MFLTFFKFQPQHFYIHG